MKQSGPVRYGLVASAVLFLTGWFGAEGAQVWVDVSRAGAGTVLGQVALACGLLLVAAGYGNQQRWAIRAWISVRQTMPFVLLLAATQYVSYMRGAGTVASAWQHAWFTMTEGLVFVSALALGVAVRQVESETFLRVVSVLISGLAVVFIAGQDQWLHQRGSETLVFGWPLANPNHSGLVFGLGILVVSGLVSHRASGLRQLERSPWREILRHKQFMIGILQLWVMVWAVVLLQSASVILATLTACVLLVLGDQYRELDWVVRKGVRWFAARIRVLVALGMMLPVSLILILGLSGLYRGAVVRVALWRDSLAMWWDGGATSWFAGRGLGRFVETYPQYQSWDAGFPTVVLAPESEAIYWLAETGLVGVVLLVVFALRLHIVPLFSRNLGVMSRDWAARIGSWALLLLAMQAMVDNTLHTRPMVYLTALIWGFSLRGAMVQSPFPSNSPQSDGQVS